MEHILIIIGLSVLIAMIIMLISWASKRDGGYDERQIAARGRVYMVSFYVLLLYNLIAGSLGFIFEWNWASSTYIFGGVGALVAMLVFVELSIWNHAYFRTRDVAWKQVLTLGLCGAVMLAVFLLNAEHLPLVVNGQLQHTALLVGLSVIDLISCVTFLLRRYLDKKAEASEAEDE